MSTVLDQNLDLDALQALGQAADSDAERGDAKLGEFLTAVAVALSRTSNREGQTLLESLKQSGVRSVPGTSANVVTVYALMGSHIVTTQDDSISASGAAFDSVYKKLKTSLYSTTRDTLAVDVARTLLSRSESLEEGAQVCLDAAPKAVDIRKCLKAATAALTALSDVVEERGLHHRHVDQYEEVLIALDRFNELAEEFPLHELQAQSQAGSEQAA